MSPEATANYEDLSGRKLNADQVEELVKAGWECVFNWTNREGYPVGVVVAYVWHNGKFWTTCASGRARVPALRARPQSAIVINLGGKTATFKGDSIIHSGDDDDWDEVKAWFFAAFTNTEVTPGDVGARNFEKLLDSPNRVIIETEASLVVSFDTAKHDAFSAEAVAAGHGVED